MKLSEKSRFERRRLAELGDSAYLSCKVQPVTGVGAEAVVWERQSEKEKKKDVQSNVESAGGGEREGGGGSEKVGRRVLGGRRCGRDCRMYCLQRWRRKEGEGASASKQAGP